MILGRARNGDLQVVFERKTGHQEISLVFAEMDYGATHVLVVAVAVAFYQIFICLLGGGDCT